MGHKTNKVTHVSYQAVLLQKFQKLTLRNRLKLIKAGLEEINISRWKHISLICKKYLKALSILLYYNGFTVFQVFHKFLQKFYFLLNFPSRIVLNSSSLLLQIMSHNTSMESLFKPHLIGCRYYDSSTMPEI